MHRSLIFLSLATLVLLASSATGQKSAIQPYLERERFMLFNACRPMRVIVSLPHADKDSDVIGLDKADLDKADLQAAAESRLRSARLYIGSMLAVIRGEANLRAGLKLKDFSRLGLLSVDVFVVGPEFSMSIEFSKILTDEFQNSSYATTWDWTTNRLHGGDASYIVSNLSQHLDHFLAAYLRVNEPACG